MLDRRYAFRAAHFVDRKATVQRFTPTLEDILLSIDGKAAMLSDFLPDGPAPSGSEYCR